VKRGEWIHGEIFPKNKCPKSEKKGEGDRGGIWIDGQTKKWGAKRQLTTLEANGGVSEKIERGKILVVFKRVGPVP